MPDQLDETIDATHAWMMRSCRVWMEMGESLLGLHLSQCRQHQLQAYQWWADNTGQMLGAEQIAAQDWAHRLWNETLTNQQHVLAVGLHGCQALSQPTARTAQHPAAATKYVPGRSTRR